MKMEGELPLRTQSHEGERVDAAGENQVGGSRIFCWIDGRAGGLQKRAADFFDVVIVRKYALGRVDIWHWLDGSDGGLRKCAAADGGDGFRLFGGGSRKGDF